MGEPWRITISLDPELHRMLRCARARRSRTAHLPVRLVARIEALASEPRLAGAQKLAGSDAAHRIRQGAYRVVYEILGPERRIVIVEIDQRLEVYR